MSQNNQNNNQSNNNSKKVIKVSGYAKRKFFDGGIEYRDFSDDLVGLQLTDEGGTPLFTLGNFKVTTNLSPKLNKTYNQGTYSDFYSLEDLDDGSENSVTLQKKQKAGLNLDVTNPLSYILYGSTEEKIRVSLEQINKYFPAAIYVSNTVGSISGNNITNYIYDSLKDETSFTIHTNYFTNPFGIEYTIDRKNDTDEEGRNPLRNLTLNYKDYVVEHNGISKKIKSFSGSTTKTNTNVSLTVEGNPFPEITGLNFSQFTFLNSSFNGSIPFFIKPNEIKREDFFSSLNNLEKNLLNRNVYPIYTATFSSPKETNQGVIVYSEEKLTFPILSDGYNLNFFDGIYITYLNNLTDIGTNLDKFKTDIIKRKYTAEVITGFDTLPSGDGSEDLDIDGAKATKLIRIYGVEFDEVKKYIDGIKFAHVVTYDKKNNTPDTLVKDLSKMLGFGEFNFLTDVNILKNVLPSNGAGLMSGTSTNLSLEEIDIELYRRLILNVAWLWKSKGARKAVEFLFRFIGAPESLINFDEYIVIADKPVNIPQLQSMLYVYTGSSDIKDLPFDSDGYPLPTPNGERVLLGFDSDNNPVYDTTWFQKAGGWYRETGGLNPAIDITEGNNSHEGIYDGGAFYMNQFITSIYPNQVTSNFITLTGNTIYSNQFINYNDGFINGTTDDDILYVTPINPLNSQIITEGIEVEFSVVPSPPISGGTTLFQDLCNQAKEEYDTWIELIKENCELVYSPEWFRIQQNYSVAKNNLNKEINSRNESKNEALEICITIDCENIEVVENPCDLYNMVKEDGLIYFTDSNGNQVNFDAFPRCCVAAGGEYFSYTNQNNQESFFCATEPPCIGKPVITTGEAVVWEIEGVNAVPDNIIEIRPNNTPISKYDEKCVKQSNEVRFDSEESRISFLKDCTTKKRKESGVSQSNNISGCFQLTEAGEYYFGFKVKPNQTEFTTRISKEVASFVIYDKNNNPVGYIPKTPGISLALEGIPAINYIKSRNGVVYPNYEKQYNQITSKDPQRALDKYLEEVRAGKIVQNFDTYFTPIDCDGKSTTMISSEECCAYYGFNHYYVNLKDENGNITTVVYCAGINNTGVIVDRPNGDSVSRPTEDIIGRPSGEPSGGKGDLYNPQKGLEKEIEKINKEQKSLSDKIKNNKTLTSKEKSKLRLENINLEQQKIDLDSQKQSLSVKNDRTIKPALEKGYTKYTPGSNVNAVTSKGEEISVIKDRKGVYNKEIKGNLGEEVTTDFGSPFGTPDLEDVTNWKIASVDQYGRITFSPTDRNSNSILNWESLSDSGADLYRECCLNKGYAFGQFQVNPTTNELVPYKNQPNDYTNGAIFDACVESTHIPCDDITDVKLVFGSNGQDGFFLPQNNESNEVTIKFDYMIKYDAESLINCAGIEICPIPLDLYTNSIYNLDCRNFIVFTEGEEYKNILDKNVKYIDTDILSSEKDEVDFSSPDKDGIPNLIPYWDSNNIQVWQTPGIQQTIDDGGECCTAYGGQYVDKELWGAINDENVKSIKSDFETTLRQIYREGGNSNDFPSWVDDDFKKHVGQLLLYTEEIQKILSEGCVDYETFRGENYCDDFNKIITTPKVCALLVPPRLGGYSEILKEYWRLINQLRLMGEQLTICVQRNEKISELIKKVDKERIEEEVDKEKKKEESLKSENLLETEYSLKEREYRNVEKQINDIVEITVAIDSVKEENLPKISCNIYQDQIKTIQNFNIVEFCQKETNSVSDNPDVVFTAYNGCLNKKRLELSDELKKYQELYQNCVKSNVISDAITESTINNDTVTKNRLITEYNVTLQNIDELQTTVFCEDIYSQNEELRVTTEQTNNIQKNVDTVAKILNVESDSIRNGNTIDLSTSQKIEVNRVLNTQKNIKNKLIIKKEEVEKDLRKITNDKEIIKKENEVIDSEKDEIIKDIKNVKDNLIKELGDIKQTKCCSDTLNVVKVVLKKLISQRSNIFIQTEKLYQTWYYERYDDYLSYSKDKMATAFEYLDELELSFNLEVDNNTIGSIPPNDIVSNLTTLPIMGDANPIWTFTPQNYSGVIIGGSQYYSNLIGDSMTTALISQGYSGLDAVFQPKWQNFELKLPQSVIDNLNGVYSDNQFFLTLTLKNYECNVCLLIDNIQINYKSFDVLPFNNTEGDGLPNLRCVIDNRKSWVYEGESINPVNYLPDGKCQENEVTCATPLQINTQNRLWQNLEYRYTEYDFNHSDLIINSKSAAFQIDPSKSIECDVYNFWKNINCDECPTSCNSGDTVYYSGSVRSNNSGNLSAYTLDLSFSATSTPLFNCNTLTNTLISQISDLKNEFYTLTADYSSSLSATYYDLLNKGKTLSEFTIETNNCNSDTIVIGNYKDNNELFSLIVEDADGTLSIFENYIYDTTTPYIGGNQTEILSGYTAQTFNQTTGLTKECCVSLNKLLNSEGEKGLGLGKNYIWDDSLSGCTWREINDGDGDCTHCGNTKHSSFTATSSGVTCEVVNKTICVNPLDFLEQPPSKIKVKEVFDEMVQRNLINAQNRQTISGYPTLKLFYELYLRANNCGEQYSGKLTYNNLFQFMDLIGDYWLELIEQVIPSTTIMEGCDNSGKVYRNTIFDHNKFVYKKYVLNYLDTTNTCSVSGVTDNSIGQQSVDMSVEEICLGGSCLPVESNDCQENIIQLQQEITDLETQLETTTDQISAVELAIITIQNDIANYNSNIISNSNNTVKDKETKDKEVKEQKEKNQKEKEQKKLIKESEQKEKSQKERENKAREKRNSVSKKNSRS